MDLWPVLVYKNASNCNSFVNGILPAFAFHNKKLEGTQRVETHAVLLLSVKCAVT